MGGMRYSVFNPDGESYVPETERFAAQKQSQAMSEWLAMQQIADRDKQRAHDMTMNGRFSDRLAGERSLLSDKLAGDTQLQVDRYAGESHLVDRRGAAEQGLEGMRQGGMNERTRMELAPRMGELKMKQDAWDLGKPAATAEAESARIRAELQAATLRDMQNGVAGPGASGGAPDPMRDDMRLVAMGGNPADVFKMRGERERYERDRNASNEDRQYTIALKMMESRNPQVRAAGAKMLSGTGVFKGQDPTVLGQGFAPEVDPADAITRSKAMAFELDGALADAKQGGDVDQIKQRLSRVIKTMVDQGVPVEEATAHVQQRLENELPTGGFMSNPVTTALHAISPLDWAGVTDWRALQGRYQNRKAYGVSPAGR